MRFQETIGLLLLLWLSASAQPSVDSVPSLLQTGNYERAQEIIDSLELAEQTQGPLHTYFRGLFHEQLDSSISLFTNLATDTSASDTLRSLAYARLGDIAYMESRQEEALQFYQKAHELFADSSYVLMSGRVERILAHTADFSAVNANPLQSGTETYTVQVGSFGSRKNALRRKKTLSGDFETVSIVEAEIEGHVYYRVRIGSFASKDQAVEFARKRLEPKRIGFSVVRQ